MLPIAFQITLNPWPLRILSLPATQPVMNDVSMAVIAGTASRILRGLPIGHSNLIQRGRRTHAAGGTHLVSSPFDVCILPEMPHAVEADGVAVVVVLHSTRKPDCNNLQMVLETARTCRSGEMSGAGRTGGTAEQSSRSGKGHAVGWLATFSRLVEFRSGI